jgi:hypothetical protein
MRGERGRTGSQSILVLINCEALETLWTKTTLVDSVDLGARRGAGSGGSYQR